MNILKTLEKKLTPYGRFKIKRANVSELDKHPSLVPSPDDDLLKVLISIGWNADGKSNWDKCIYFLKELRDSVDYGLADHEYSTSANLLLLWTKSKHKTSCGYYSMVYADILNSHGIPCRQIAGWAIEPLPGRSYSYLPADIIVNHLTCEAWIDNKWILLDPTDGGWFENKQSEKLSALQIQSSLVQSEKIYWKGVADNEAYCYPGLFAFLIYPVSVGLIPYAQTILKNFWLGGWFLAMRKDPPLLIHSLQGGATLFFWRWLAASLSLISIAVIGLIAFFTVGWIVSLMR